MPGPQPPGLMSTKEGEAVYIGGGFVLLVVIILLLVWAF